MIESTSLGLGASGRSIPGLQVTSEEATDPNKMPIVAVMQKAAHLQTGEMLELVTTFIPAPGTLERVTWRSNASGETSINEIRHVFIMARASPRTDWLSGCLALDNKGFILTGRDLDAATETPVWPLARPPQMLETSLPGVFAVWGRSVG